MSTTQQATLPLVLEERSGAVLTLRLNRPEKLNALNPALCSQLVQGLLRAGEDKSVRAVVLTGAGRGFCSGADINFMRDTRSRRAVHEFKAMLETGKEICLAIASMPKVVIAAVNGAAAGGGMSLALACDLRIASEPAIFTQAFGQLALYPDFGATFFLPRRNSSLRKRRAEPEL
jgi:2-(1,2-epoxy-1,2-dihydrophenyl)acetyl-CoA isomerase